MYLDEIIEKMFNDVALGHSNIALSKRYEGSNKGVSEKAASRVGGKPRE